MIISKIYETMYNTQKPKDNYDKRHLHMCGARDDIIDAGM